MAGAFKIAIVFVAMSIVLFMGLSMIAQVPAPESGTSEYTQFTSLTKIVNVGYYGFYVVLIILLAVAIIAAVMMRAW